jgi:hypothetical protein
MANKPKVLSLRIGAQVSLDLVWQNDICLVVLAERGALNRRTIARLEVEQAMAAARFLARVDPLPPLPPPVEEDDDLTPTEHKKP